MRRVALFPLAVFVMAWGTEAPSHPVRREPYTAIVRQVSGGVRSVGDDTTEATDVKVGDIPEKGRTFVTAENGLLVMRFHPDFMRIEARSRTRFQLSYPRADSTRERRLTLIQGQMVFGVTRHGPPLAVEDAHSSARTGDARFSFTSNSEASTLVVLDGVVKVHNNTSDETGTITRSRKAVSDAKGLHITDASAGDLKEVGLRQNTIEVDFWNPATEKSSTLEMEYENNF